MRYRWIECGSGYISESEECSEIELQMIFERMIMREKKGVYITTYSSNEEMVAWDNVSFVFGSTEDGFSMDSSLLQGAILLFKVYGREYERFNRCWKESFNISSLNAPLVGVYIFISPVHGEENYSFVVYMLKELIAIDNLEKLEAKVEDAGLQLKFNDESEKEALNRALPNISTLLKGLLEITEKEGRLRRDIL